MPAQWPSPLYTDGSLSTAKACSLPVFSNPVPNTTNEYMLQQDFMQFRTNFTATALNTPHPSANQTPDYSSFLLVAEGERRDMGGGVCRWTRTYMQVPNSYDEPETYNYSFIGNTGISGVNVPTVKGRNRQNLVVTSFLKHDFFVANGATVTDPITGESIAIQTAGDIPKVWAMQYVYQVKFNNVVYGGIFYPTDFIDLAASTSPTYPTIEEYKTQVADALTNGWAATRTVVKVLSDATIDTSNTTLGGLIPVEDSRIARFMGNIFVRSTRYVQAQ